MGVFASELATGFAHSGNLEELKNLRDETRDPSFELEMKLVSIACEKGHLEILEYIVDTAYRGKRLLENWGDWEPSHFAAFHGRVNILEYLKDNAPNKSCALQAETKGLTTPAHLAAKGNNLEALRYIVQHAPLGAQVLVGKDDEDESDCASFVFLASLISLDKSQSRD